jgi:hypothetical protein
MLARCLCSLCAAADGVGTLVPRETLESSLETGVESKVCVGMDAQHNFSDGVTGDKLIGTCGSGSGIEFTEERVPR